MCFKMVDSCFIHLKSQAIGGSCNLFSCLFSQSYFSPYISLRNCHESGIKPEKDFKVFLKTCQ